MMLVLFGAQITGQTDAVATLANTGTQGWFLAHRAQRSRQADQFQHILPFDVVGVEKPTARVCFHVAMCL